MSGVPGRAAGALLALGLLAAPLAAGGGDEPAAPPAAHERPAAAGDAGAPATAQGEAPPVVAAPAADSASTAPPAAAAAAPTPAAAPAAAPEDGPLGRLATFSRGALTAAGLQRVEVDAAGRRLVLWRGGSGPHLVLLHGSGHQAGAWAAVVKGLLADHTLHVLDLPGHGDSEPASGPLAMGVVVEGVEAYLATLDGKATLVGNSFGAWLATVQAHRHPETVERLVLVNGGALFHVPAEGLSLTPADREAARRVMAALRDPASPPLSDEVLDDVVRRAGSGPIGRLLQDPPSLVAHLLDGRLGEVTVPVDVLWGASDRLMTADYARRMAAGFPRARLTFLDGCGHIPHGECPDRFLTALRRVLEQPPPEGPVAPPQAAPAATPDAPDTGAPPEGRG